MDIIKKQRSKDYAAFEVNRLEKQEGCAPTVAGSDMVLNHAIISKSQMWAVSDDCYLPCEQSCASMPAKCYTINQSIDRGIYFKQLPLNTDSLLNLPDASTEIILEQIAKFWTKEALYRKHGMLFKRGFLLHGPAGSGKTSTIQLVCQQIIKNNGIAVFVANPTLTVMGLSVFRKIEPKRSLVVILEDIDAMIASYGESNILALLDGEYQIDNVVYIATTNYPERLDLRLVNRPSRFDLVKLIEMPNDEARRMYLKHKSQRFQSSNDKELDRWVRDTFGLSIAHIKELIIAVDILDEDYDITVERLHGMSEVPCSNENKHVKVQGFGG